MHIASKTAALLISAIGLSGCDGPLEPFAFDTTYSSFADIDAALSADVAANVDEDGSLVNPGEIASAADFDSVAGGSAIYNGAIIAEESASSETLIGQVQITTVFDTNRIDGVAGNFFHSDDGAFGGTLRGNSVFSEDVDSEGNHFKMDLTGTLDDDGSLFDATITLEGNFLNSPGDVSHVAGDADVVMGGGPDYAEGGFSAAR